MGQLQAGYTKQICPALKELFTQNLARGCGGQRSVLVEVWKLLIYGWLQEVLRGPGELPKKFCGFDKNFKALKLQG